MQVIRLLPNGELLGLFNEFLYGVGFNQATNFEKKSRVGCKKKMGNPKGLPKIKSTTMN